MIGMALLALIAAPAFAEAAPDMYCGESNVQTLDGTVQLARQWEVVFEEAFEEGRDQWKIENFESKLAIRLDEHGDTGNCVLVTNEGAKGDTALSISYTAVVSVVSVLTLPLIAAFSLNYFMGANAPDMNILMLGLQMVLITIIPVGIGLWIHTKKQKFTKKFEPIASKISSGLFALIVVAALASEWDTFVENVKVLGPAIIILIVVMLLIGYFSSKMFKMKEPQAVSVAVATGIQNATVGIAIGNIILPATEGLSIFSLPSGVYGILMYLVVLPIIFLYVKFVLKRKKS